MNIAVVHTEMPGTKMKIEKKHLDMVKAAMPGARVILDSPENLISSGVDADILICWATEGGYFICEEYCRRCTGLKWVHALSAGVEGITSVPSIVEIPELRLTNSGGIHGIPIAEHVLGYMLGRARGFEQIRANQLAHRWQGFTPDELYGKTVSILGLGAIGKEIATRCKAFGMTVIGVKRSKAEVPNVDAVYTGADMDEAIAQADYVVLVLPYARETERLFGKEKFKLMKTSAHFINVGRGMTADTEALIEALREKRIRGAMLDAFEKEPLPPDSPLWEMANVFISPHISAQTPAYMDRAFAVFQKNAAAYLAGERMPNEVDLPIHPYIQNANENGKGINAKGEVKWE